MKRQNEQSSSQDFDLSARISWFFAMKLVITKIGVTWFVVRVVACLLKKRSFVGLLSISFFLGSILGVMLYSQTCHAQEVNDTLSVRRSYELKKQKLAFQLSLDNRHSFLGNTPILVTGLNAGLRIKGKYRVGIGAYTIGVEYDPISIFSNRTQTADTVSSALQLDFLTPNFTYTFLDRRWIELSIPLEAGLGQQRSTEQPGGTHSTHEIRSIFVPVSVGAGVLLKPNRWMGVTMLAGYRKSLENNHRDGFDGWYYGYRVNFFLGNLIRDLKEYRSQKQNLKPIS
jgi:hypothetical protein